MWTWTLARKFSAISLFISAHTFTCSDSQSRVETSAEAKVTTRKKVNVGRGEKAKEPVRKLPQRAFGASFDVTSKPKDDAETYRVMQLQSVTVVSY